MEAITQLRLNSFEVISLKFIPTTCPPLRAGQVPESWKSSLRLFKWHCQFTSVSKAAYNDLQRNILPSFGITIESIRMTQRMLAAYVGIKVNTYDCCVKHCTVFIGANALSVVL
jgi:hypothetical protein